MVIHTAGQVTRLIAFAEARFPDWKFFFHPMASSENTKQAWTAVPVHPVRAIYWKETFYRGEAVQGLRALLTKVKEIKLGPPPTCTQCPCCCDCPEGDPNCEFQQVVKDTANANSNT